LRRLRQSLGLPRVSWQTYLAAVAVLLTLSWLTAVLFPYFLGNFFSYNPSYYEPKDFQRGDYLLKKKQKRHKELNEEMIQE
jgi:hypothetical protein